MHHEGQRRNLKRDAMRRKLARADPTHHQRRCLEQPALGQTCQPDRQAQPENLRISRPVGPPDPLKQRKPAQRRLPCRVDGKGSEGKPLHAKRRNRRAAHPQFRRAELAEDQHPVHRGIDRHPRQRDPQDHLRALVRGQVAFQHHHKKRGHHPPTGDTKIILRKRRDVILLPCGQQQRTRPPHHRHAQDAELHRQPQPHAGVAAHLRIVLGPKCRRHHAHHADAKARAKDEHDEKHRRAEHYGGKLGHAIPTKHHGVRDMQRHLRQMRADQRQAKTQRGAKMCTRALGGNGVHEQTLQSGLIGVQRQASPRRSVGLAYDEIHQGRAAAMARPFGKVGIIIGLMQHLPASEGRAQQIE